ncbi:hypothetical protein MKY34_08575 [Sporosarcina sp. FSL K6-1522]|uniref:hypothetical protein n=1 Tax=Sporosarcina sp. FSL K6-1522 TaxID=2921554 RepID=UPI00315ABB2E
MNTMKKQLNINGKSQYAEDIYEKFRPSACGPVTARVILDQFAPEVCPYDANKLYTMLGSTRIGLSKRRLIGNLRNLLGAGWTVADCTVEEVKRQIDRGYAVAAKFDKWFTFRWRGHYAFDYHWVPVIGYEETDNDVMLIIHDNGGRNRPSQVRQVSYKRNKPVLSFVKIEPKNLSTD